ncbi:hypothetical protein CR513_19917, partial [Mucuna pruriens]
MYHPEANVVADALSRKIVHMSALMVKELELVEKFRNVILYVERRKDHISYGVIMVINSFLETMKEKTKELLGTNKAEDFNLGEDGILRCKGRIAYHKTMSYKSRLRLHLGTTKKCQDLKMFR